MPYAVYRLAQGWQFSTIITGLGLYGPSCIVVAMLYWALSKTTQHVMECVTLARSPTAWLNTSAST